MHDKGVEHTGLFGIGFFSVFMVGDRVRVISRFYRGTGETNVLDFQSGYGGRPTLRAALSSEALVEPGTEVAAFIHGSDSDAAICKENWKDVVVKSHSVKKSYGVLSSLESTIEWTFPATDVNIATI